MVAFGGEGTAGFQTCGIADVPIGGTWKSGARLSGGRHAGLETRDTADLEVCGTTTGQSDRFSLGQCQDALDANCEFILWWFYSFNPVNPVET
jgi:hypothetical protein